MAENRASEYTEGTPCWVDAQLPDLEAGKRFYGELFGWTFEDQPTGTVRASKDGDPVASLAHKTDGRLPTVWTVSFFTPDADALCARIRAAAVRWWRPRAVRRPRPHRARHRPRGRGVLAVAARHHGRLRTPT